jgi:Membrane-bound metallopeptidase
MADSPSDDLDLNLSVHAEGVELAKALAKNVADLRKELELLAKQSTSSSSSGADEANKKAKQAADELRASARQIAADRQKAANDERAANKQRADELQASNRQIAADRQKAAEQERKDNQQRADELRASARQISADRKKAADDVRAANRAQTESNRQAANEDRAVSKQQADELRASARQISADRKKALEQQRADDAAKKAEERKAAADERASQLQLRDELRASARQISADRKKALEEERAANRARLAEERRLAAEEKANAKLQQDSTGIVQGLTAAFGRLGLAVIAARAAFAGFQAFKAFTSEGLQFNSVIENANVGIGALITAQAKLHDADGNLLTGTKALGAAQELAAEQVTKLRIAGLQTLATTEDLVKAFQQAVGIGLRYGLTLDQAREFTVQMAQAAAALQLPMDQLNEEIRSLLQGTINPRNTRIASALHITNEQIRQAKESGQLFDFVSKRLEAFSVAGEATAKTFSGSMSNIKEALQQLTGEATKPLFEQLKQIGIKSLEDIFDMKNARISEKFSGIIEVAQDVFGELGSLLADAIGAGIKGAEEFSRWLKENKFIVDDIFASFKLVVGQVKGLLKDIAQVVTFLVGGATELGFFNVALRMAALFVAGLRDGFKLIVGVLGIVGETILKLILNPFILLLDTIASVVQFFDKDMANSLKETANKVAGFLNESGEAAKDIFRDFANGKSAVQDVIKQFDEMGKAADKTTKKVKETSKTLATVTTNDPNDVKRDPSKLAAGITAAAKAELSRQQRDLKIALDQNLISYDEYYSQLTKAQQHSIDEQIRAQNILLNAAKTDDARDKIKSDIHQLSEERIQVAQDNAEKLRQALEKLDDEIRKAQIQLLKDQGKNAEARALEVEGEFQKMQKRLIKNSKSDGAKIVANLFDIDNAKAQMQDFERQVKVIQDNLKNEQEDINTQLEAHTITQRQAQNKLADSYQVAHDKLAAILPIMEKVAAVTQDPASLQAVKDLRLQLGQWELTIKRARDDLLELKEGALETFQTGIANLLDETAQGFQDWGERVKSVGRQIVDSLRQIAAQMLATLIIQNALKFFGFAGGGLVGGGGGSQPAQLLSGDVRSGVSAASGGYITGPGTSTSDSIPAWLSHGEYVINAKAVKTVGVNLLEGINSLGRSPARVRRRTHGFAEGGLVASTSNDASIDNRLTVGLEDGLVIKHLESPSGQAAQVRFIEKNAVKIRRALGIG